MVTCRVRSSKACTPSSVSASPEARSSAPTMSPRYVSATVDSVSGCRARSQEYLKSWAVTARPSWNRAFVPQRKGVDGPVVGYFPSFSQVGGTTSNRLFSVTRPLNMAPTMPPAPRWVSAGSMVTISPQYWNSESSCAAPKNTGERRVKLPMKALA